MAAAAPRLPGRATGVLVLAGGGFMPARLLLAPVGARLPPGVNAVAAVSVTPVVAALAGSGSRARSLVARAAAGGLDSFYLEGDAVDDSFYLEGDAVDDSLALDGATDPTVVATADAGVVPSLALNGATDSTVAAASKPVLSIGYSTWPAARVPARGLRGEVSAAGMASAALFRGGRSSRGARLVVAATAGSEGEARDDNGLQYQEWLLLPSEDATAMKEAPTITAFTKEHILQLIREFQPEDVLVETSLVCKDAFLIEFIARDLIRGADLLEQCMIARPPSENNYLALATIGKELKLAVRVPERVPAVRVVGQSRGSDQEAPCDVSRNT